MTVWLVWSIIVIYILGMEVVWEAVSSWEAQRMWVDYVVIILWPLAVLWGIVLRIADKIKPQAE